VSRLFVCEVYVIILKYTSFSFSFATENMFKLRATIVAYRLLMVLKIKRKSQLNKFVLQFDVIRMAIANNISLCN